jgi:NAD(P)-dependent dehydrogenase (short-subunit alcohol dehydrogenase family)
MPVRAGSRRPCRSLSGQVAIVAGAGSAGDDIGNGRAVAILLAEDGASVVCVDLDLSMAERTIDDHGGG